MSYEDSRIFSLEKKRSNGRRGDYILHKTQRGWNSDPRVDVKGKQSFTVYKLACSNRPVGRRHWVPLGEGEMAFGGTGCRKADG